MRRERRGPAVRAQRMTHGSSFWPIALLMFATGIGIPILATLNAGLGYQLSNAPTATFILFGIGFVVSGIIAASVGFPPRSAFSGGEPYRYLAALFMVFYILSVTWSAPRIGLANAIFFVLLGQMVAAATIDHFGLWGALKTTLTPRRAVGILIMAVGLYLARKPV